MAVGFGTTVRTDKQNPEILFSTWRGTGRGQSHTGAQAGRRQVFEMPSDLMASGGRVVVRPMVEADIGGLTQEERIPGVETGGQSGAWTDPSGGRTTVPSRYAQANAVDRARFQLRFSLYGLEYPSLCRGEPVP